VVVMMMTMTMMMMMMMMINPLALEPLRTSQLLEQLAGSVDVLSTFEDRGGSWSVS
jgi:hypothetical protein